MQTLYFVNEDGPGALNGDPTPGFSLGPQSFELWKIAPDGTAVIAADIFPGPAGSLPFFFTPFNGEIYFSAYTADFGRELWKIAPDGSVVLAADIAPGPTGSGPFFHEVDDPSDYTTVVYNGELYFVASTPATGLELWKVKADGSVVLAADIVPGPGDSDPLDGNVAEHFLFNGEFYFTADGAAAVAANPTGLWKVTTDGSVVAAGHGPFNGLTNGQSYAAFNGSIYFAGNGTDGSELWRIASDGTVSEVADIYPGVNSSIPSGLTVFNGTLYFSADDPAHGEELWKVDSSGVPSLAMDINPGPSSSSPFHFQVINNALYFSTSIFEGSPVVEHDALWRVDTSGAVTHVADTGANLTVLATFNGATYFFGIDDASEWQLWKFAPDGSAVFVADLGTSAVIPFPYHFAEFNGELYFPASIGGSGIEVWKLTAGGAIVQVTDINPGAADANPFYADDRLIEHAVVNGELYFTATAPGGLELWKVKADGTAVRVTDGTPDSFPLYLNVLATAGLVTNNDDFATTETTAIGVGRSVFNDNGHGIDTDSVPFTVNTVNGSGANVGAVIAFASGAFMTVNADGRFSYDPNHAYDLLPAPDSGATNTTTTDTFTYTATDGSVTSPPTTGTVTVTGVDSNDLLYGSFGAGTTLAGGILNDTYVVHNAATAINDASGTLDVVYAEGLSYSLAAHAQPGIEAMIVENGTGLTGTGNSSAATILFSLSAPGDSYALIGGGAADFIVGGLGADSLQGGDGNDTYIVHSTATTIGDTGGFDVAYAEGVNLALADGDGVDAAILEGDAGHTLTGHQTAPTILFSLDAAGQSNTLVGGSGNDFIVGGLGADHLQGGAGDDTYIVNSTATTISDSAGATDVAYAENVNFALADGDGVEYLIQEGSGRTAIGHATTATGIYSTGSGNTLIGGSAGDLLVAGAGGDTLIGNGGNDLLVAGAGNDGFQFGTAFGQDAIYNFHPHDGGSNQDTIRLTGEAPGTTFASMVAANLIFEAPDASQPLGTDVVVEHDANNYVVLLNHHVADLSASDFVFG